MSDTGVLHGKRALLVEDETLVAMLVEDMLADEGCTVSATATRLGEALRVAGDRTVEFDFAILDVNLAGDPIFPVAEALAARGVPFAFATGYGAGGLPENWRNRPTLQKPFTAGEIVGVLTRIFEG